MATAILTLSNLKPGVTIAGKRMVEATVDFDTGDYVANGWDLSTVSVVVGATTYTGLLAAIGLKQLESMFVAASVNTSQTAYTQAQWITGNTTTSYSYFLDTATNGTLQAPRLVVYSAGAVLSGAVAAAAQFRASFAGH